MFHPGVAYFAPALADAFFKLIVNAIGYQEFFVRPTIEFLGKRHFFLAQRFAVSFFRVLAVGSAPANVAVDDNQCWLIAGVAENIQRLFQGPRVVGIGDMLYTSSRSL